MLVSVIIPTCRRPERLAKALGSLRAQSYGCWQAVVVDDCDGAVLELVQRLADPRIRAVMNTGKGQVSARNLAIGLSTGEVIAWLDDDDWWEDVFHLEHVVAVHRLSSVLVHRYGWIVHEGQGFTQHWEIFDLPACSRSLRSDNSILTSSVSYPRVWHDRLGMLDESLGSYFDWDWYLRVMDAGYPLKTLASCGVCYLVHGSNVSTGKSAVREKNFRDFCNKHGLSLEQKNHQLLFDERRVSSMPG